MDSGWSFSFSLSLSLSLSLRDSCLGSSKTFVLGDGHGGGGGTRSSTSGGGTFRLPQTVSKIRISFDEAKVTHGTNPREEKALSFSQVF